MAQEEMSKKLKLMGRKRGMVQLFDETGRKVPCTVIEVEPNQIVQLKTKETDGYCAVQVGYEKRTAKDPRTLERRTNKPLSGHYKKAGVEPRRHLQETRVEDTEGLEVGQEFGVEMFEGVNHLDIIGTTIGKGYQGWIKLYNFKGGPASHGSGFHRHPGSLGMRSTPGRVLPGGTPAKRMGGRRQTVQNLEVVQLDKEKQLVIVKGSVPGANGALVTMSASLKKHVQAA